MTVEVPDLCPRFSARVFTDVQIGPSPPWLKARLTAAGMRPINNVVDITNYVMLMTAQPLHAFDLDKVPDGEIIVRSARDGEKMTTLDGTERTFDADTVLVCDRNGPTGVAGIMGGLVSEVSETTTRVLLEVATWNGVNILRTSRKLGLRSDASNRNEKQLHPDLALRAQRVASQLMVELCGARLVPGTIDAAAEIPEARQVRLRAGRAEKLLGLAIPLDDQVKYLRRLEFGVETTGDDIEATVPFHRHYDVTREADLIEEVGRIHGYADHLPATLPDRDRERWRAEPRAAPAPPRRGSRARPRLRRRRHAQPHRSRAATAAADSGRRSARRDDRDLQPALTRPLGSAHDTCSAACSTSRATTSPTGLAPPRFTSRAARTCAMVSRSAPAPSAATSPASARRPRMSRGALPASRPAQTSTRSRVCSKGLPPGSAGPIEVEQGSEPFLSPGRAGRVLVEGEAIGWVGEVHPLVCRAWDLDAAVGFEIDLAPLVDASPSGDEQYEDVITYPAVEQDIAVIVADDIEAARVRAVVADAGGELLRSISIFDLYRGDQVGEGHKSLALRLEFRAADRTLTDEEVAEVRERIEAALAEQLDGSLRG